MKKVIVLLCIIFVGTGTYSRCQQPLDGLDKIPKTVKHKFENQINTFSFEVATNDKFYHIVKGNEDDGIEVKGIYAYLRDDGDTQEVFYTAGKNGFKPIIKIHKFEEFYGRFGSSLCASIDGCGLG